MEKNKWIIEVSDSYTIGGKTVSKVDSISIPPTDGDRTDIIGESGKYYYNTTKKQFMKRVSKEEHLADCLPGLSDKEQKKAIKEIDWTPREIDDHIAVIIEIKKGEINIKGK